MIKKINVYPSEANQDSTAFAKLIVSKVYDAIKTEYGSVQTYDENNGIIWANGMAGITINSQNSSTFTMKRDSHNERFPRKFCKKIDTYTI